MSDESQQRIVKAAKRWFAARTARAALHTPSTREGLDIAVDELARAVEQAEGKAP